jgi:hypothetical protein
VEALELSDEAVEPDRDRLAGDIADRAVHDERRLERAAADVDREERAAHG